MASVVVAIVIPTGLYVLNSVENKRHMTLTLHSTYRSLDDIQSLIDLGERVYLDMYERFSNNPDIRELLRETFLNLTNDKPDEVDGWIAVYFRASDIIYDCGWVKRTCEKDILLDTYASEIVNAYIGIRYGIYCDDEIWGNEEIPGLFRNSIENHENILMEFFERFDAKRKKEFEYVANPPKKKSKSF